MVSLQEKEGKINAEISFNVDNTGDRATTIIRTNVILGPDVEVIEGLRNISAHSSIRVPKKTDSSVKFAFPEDVNFLNGTQKRYFDKKERLQIIVTHTHDKLERSYNLPASSEWKEKALFKGGPAVFVFE